MRTEDILLAVKPKFSAMIKAGAKTVEIRKIFPKHTTGRRVYIYSSSPECRIIGFFYVSSLEHLPLDELWSRVKNISGLNTHEFFTYFSGKNMGIAIHFDKFICLNKAIMLSEIRKEHPSFTPPQNYRYMPPQIALYTTFG